MFETAFMVGNLICISKSDDSFIKKDE